MNPSASAHTRRSPTIPVIGEALFRQTPLTYLAFAAVLFVAWLLNKTPIGLAIRTVGKPSAAEAQGVDVTLVRMGAVMLGSALMDRRKLHYTIRLQFILL